MGSGSSKKQSSSDDQGIDRERRRSSAFDMNPPAQSTVLVPCGTCGRKFATDRIQKHAEVCAKTAQKRREAFDVQGQRLEGTEAEEMRDEINELEVTRSPGEWRRAHERMLKDIKKDKTHKRPVSALDNIEIRA